MPHIVKGLSLVLEEQDEKTHVTEPVNINSMHWVCQLANRTSFVRRSRPVAKFEMLNVMRSASFEPDVSVEIQHGTGHLLYLLVGEVKVHRQS